MVWSYRLKKEVKDDDQFARIQPERAAKKK
jgi:hypothetical protein